MAKVNATEYAEKWGRRMKGSTEDMRRGIEKVTVAPGVMAAKQVDLMKAKLIKSIEDGTWARNVAKLGVEDWKKLMIDKGINRVSAGVDAAAGNQVVMAEKLLAAVDASVAEVNKTPRGTLEDNINRMVTFSRGMAKRKIK
jgi:hypothetical protein